MGLVGSKLARRAALGLRRRTSDSSARRCFPKRAKSPGTPPLQTCHLPARSPIQTPTATALLICRTRDSASAPPSTCVGTPRLKQSLKILSAMPPRAWPHLKLSRDWTAILMQLLIRLKDIPSSKLQIQKTESRRLHLHCTKASSQAFAMLRASIWALRANINLSQRATPTR